MTVLLSRNIPRLKDTISKFAKHVVFTFTKFGLRKPEVEGVNKISKKHLKATSVAFAIYGKRKGNSVYFF